MFTPALPITVRRKEISVASRCIARRGRATDGRVL